MLQKLITLGQSHPYGLTKEILPAMFLPNVMPNCAYTNLDREVLGRYKSSPLSFENQLRYPTKYNHY